jgi:DNA-binding transcriptional LysR family regulator
VLRGAGAIDSFTASDPPEIPHGKAAIAYGDGAAQRSHGESRVTIAPRDAWTMRPTERSFARRIDLTSLQLFVAVCELGSIGRAAEREFIAASAVSKRLSDLETTLETPLLYRHTRGVKLMPAGETLLHHARSVLFSLEKMQAELSEYADGIRGHVRIHANISAIVQFLPEDLGSFSREHPQVKIDLEEHLSGDVIRAVHEGAADLGICNVAAAGDRELQSLPYRHDELVVIVPRGHALAKRAAVAFADTLDFDHVGLHANSSIYVAMREAATAAGRAIRLRIHVTGLDAMCRMIHNGLGVGIMPRRAFALMHGVGDLEGVRLTDDWARRDIRLFARDFSTLPLTARLLVDHLRARAEEPQALAA